MVSISCVLTQATLSMFHSSLCRFSCRLIRTCSLSSIFWTTPSTFGRSSITRWRHSAVLLHAHALKKTTKKKQTRKSKCSCVCSVVKRNVSSNRSAEFLCVKHRLLWYLLMTEINFIKETFFLFLLGFVNSFKLFPHSHRLISSQSGQTVLMRRAKQNPHKPNCTSLSFFLNNRHIYISEYCAGNSKNNDHFPFLFKCSTERQHCTDMYNDRNKQSNTAITATARGADEEGVCLHPTSQFVCLYFNINIFLQPIYNISTNIYLSIYLSDTIV